MESKSHRVVILEPKASGGSAGRSPGTVGGANLPLPISGLGVSWSRIRCPRCRARKCGVGCDAGRREAAMLRLWHCLWQGLVSSVSTAGKSLALVTARDTGGFHS